MFSIIGLGRTSWILSFLTLYRNLHQEYNRTFSTPEIQYFDSTTYLYDLTRDALTVHTKFHFNWLRDFEAPVFPYICHSHWLS